MPALSAALRIVAVVRFRDALRRETGFPLAPPPVAARIPCKAAAGARDAALAYPRKIGYRKSTMRTLSFPPPVPVRERRRIHPVFLPFAGCPYRCVFCSQEVQSGAAARPVSAVLAALEETLRAAVNNGEDARELAFYGGTFTALPLEAQLACLELAARFREQGLITRVRASTRPDCVTRQGLGTLRKNGLDMLELGVQSFDDAVLRTGRPGYTGGEALAACALVRESGMALGIQLMPGMPGMDAAMFRRDVRLAVDAGPETLRLYPCLVIEGTGLAALWRKGLYTPWDIDATIALLAEALLLAEAAGVAVIRMGLAPEPGLAPHILAGPNHPALGARVRGRALFELVRWQCAKLGIQPDTEQDPGPDPGLQPGATPDVTPAMARGAANVRPPFRQEAGLTLPRRLRGEFGGHRGELIPLYAALGLDRKKIRWHDREDCELTG